MMRLRAAASGPADAMIDNDGERVARESPAAAGVVQVFVQVPED